MNVYIARQPIYDKERQLYGYEFLYRDSDVNSFNPDIDGSAATRTLISNLINEFGLELMTGGHYAFVNFTRELLTTDFPFLLDNKQFVIEILENIALDDSLLLQLQKLKSKGYKVALDDYVGGALENQLESVELLKVDFMQTTLSDRHAIASCYKERLVLLAEKIESEEDFNSAVDMGYTLFQGYYFSRPVPFSKPVTQIASATCSLLWEEIRRPCPNFHRLADIILKDVDLMYKFISKANSLIYYRGNRVTDIHNALVRMGIIEIRHWVIMIIVNDITGNGNSERTKLALMRGTFAEKIASKIGGKTRKEEAYLAGMFSVIETDMKSDLFMLLDKLMVPSQVSDALLGKSGLLTDLLHFVYAYEAGDWEQVCGFVTALGLNEKWVVKQYMDSINYAEQTFSA